MNKFVRLCVSCRKVKGQSGHHFLCESCWEEKKNKLLEKDLSKEETRLNKKEQNEP